MNTQIGKSYTKKADTCLNENMSGHEISTLEKKKRSGLLGDHRTPGGFGGLAMGAGPVNWQTNWATSKQNSNFDSKKNDSKLVLGSLLSENHSFRMHS